MPVYKLTDTGTGKSYWMLAGTSIHAKTVLSTVMDLSTAKFGDLECKLDFKRSPAFGFIEHENGSLTEIPWNIENSGLEP